MVEINPKGMKLGQIVEELISLATIKIRTGIYHYSREIDAMKEEHPELLPENREKREQELYRELDKREDERYWT